MHQRQKLHADDCGQRLPQEGMRALAAQGSAGAIAIGQLSGGRKAAD